MLELESKSYDTEKKLQSVVSSKKEKRFYEGTYKFK